MKLTPGLIFTSFWNISAVCAIIASTVVIVTVAETGSHKGKDGEKNPFTLFSQDTPAIVDKSTSCISSSELQTHLANLEQDWTPVKTQKRRILPSETQYEKISHNVWKVFPSRSHKRFEEGITGRLHIHRVVDHDTVRNVSTTLLGDCPSSNSCYEYISEGFKWKTQPHYSVDGSNDMGISASTLYEKLEAARQTWNDLLPCQIWNSRSIFPVPDGIDYDYPDGKNEITFEEVEDDNILAMVISWGFFDGPVEDREIVESDMVFNTRSRADSYPFECVALHEWGHMFGLTDLYDNDCIGRVMYGYTDTRSGVSTCPLSLTDDDAYGVRSLYSDQECNVTK